MTAAHGCDANYGAHGETAHIRSCERPSGECVVCHSWWREVLEAVAEGRIRAPEADPTEQTTLSEVDG